MITNFKVQVPELEVILPQGNKSYRVRTLKADDEFSIRSSLYTTTSAMNKKLNEVIYNSIADTDKPKFEDWLKITTTKDRDALIYGIYEITYGDEYPLDNYRCPQCGNEESLKIKLSDGFNINVYKPQDIKVKETNEEGKEIEVVKPGKPLYEIEKEIELAPNFKVVIHQPTLAYEQIILDTIKEDDPMIKMYRKIKKLKIKQGREWNELTFEENNIDYMYVIKENLYANFKKRINKEYKDTFGIYETKVMHKHKCKQCGHEHEFSVNFIDQFFLLVFQDEE